MLEAQTILVPLTDAIMDKSYLQRFKDLTYADFRRRAQDPDLSRYEKIGFPNAYRAGKEASIFRDVLSKLHNLQRRRQIVLDIGPGCSELPQLLLEHCRSLGHTLLLADSEEMLRHLPDGPGVEKFPCYFPDCPDLFARFEGKVNTVLTYSVLHCGVFGEGNLFRFFDKALRLLAPGGEWLIGDIPNVSKRKRFFSSSAGIAFHQEFTGTTERPEVHFSEIEEGKIDDAVLIGLVLRARGAGFDAYLLPQPESLPLANRREDLLIRRP